MAEQNINGIVIDLNRITRREFRKWTKQLDATDDHEERDELTAKLAAQVITRWPYGDVSADGYLDLGMADSQLVDQALTEALSDISKKK